MESRPLRPGKLQRALSTTRDERVERSFLMTSIPQNLAPLKVEEPGKSTQNGQTSNLNRTDAGNATRFIKRHGANVRYCHPWQKWLVFREGYWMIDETGEIIRLA